MGMCDQTTCKQIEMFLFFPLCKIIFCLLLSFVCCLYACVKNVRRQQKWIYPLVSRDGRFSVLFGDLWGIAVLRLFSEKVDISDLLHWWYHKTKNTLTTFLPDLCCLVIFGDYKDLMKSKSRVLSYMLVYT